MKPEENVPDGDSLPSQFADLQDFVAEFGISDDFLRDQSEQAATRERKQEFVDRVMPRMTVICEYLDEHDDESAHMLGTLAEAATELAFELNPPERRPKES